MKILVVCQYYYPENFQINTICSDLVQRGHEVTVLTGLPNYPNGIIPEGYKHGNKRDEIIDGVHIIRCFEVGRKKGIVGLAFNYFSYCISAAIRAKNKQFDFDVIYSYQLSPVTMVYPATILKKKYKKPLFLYCCDLWPESMKVLLKGGNNILFKVTAAISKSLYNKCDKIAIQSPAFFEYFEKQHGIVHEKLCFIPQFADSSYLSISFRDVHEITNFVFLGNVGIAQDMECVLRAVKHIKEIQFRLHIVGDGSCLDNCKQMVNEYSIEDKVIFYGRRPVDEMPKYYELADACLITLKDDSMIGRTIPSKLQGYMAAGKVVIGAINGAAQDVIKEANCGLCVAASDDIALAEAMREFIINRKCYLNCGSNGREYFKKHFTKEIFMDNLEKKLKEMCDIDRYSRKLE